MCCVQFSVLSLRLPEKLMQCILVADMKCVFNLFLSKLSLFGTLLNFCLSRFVCAVVFSFPYFQVVFPLSSSSSLASSSSFCCDILLVGEFFCQLFSGFGWLGCVVLFSRVAIFHINTKIRFLSLFVFFYKNFSLVVLFVFLFEIFCNIGWYTRVNVLLYVLLFHQAFMWPHRNYICVLVLMLNVLFFHFLSVSLLFVFVYVLCFCSSSFSTRFLQTLSGFYFYFYFICCCCLLFSLIFMLLLCCFRYYYFSVQLLQKYNKNYNKSNGPKRKMLFYL